jgi:hypothetical protein
MQGRPGFPVTGKKVETDEDKALASWYWRNWHVFHNFAGQRDFTGKGFDDLEDHVEYPREYWSGLFADGFAICYATHAQWCGEMEELLGRGRCRAMEIHGHTTFEAYPTGGAYGSGRWALLDHDISTVIFAPDGSRLMSLAEIRNDPTAQHVRAISRERQHGWLPAGLYADDIPYSAWRQNRRSRERGNSEVCAGKPSNVDQLLSAATVEMAWLAGRAFQGPNR